MEEIEKLKKENATLLKEVIYLRGLQSSSEKWWILFVRAIAFIIGFLPFIPNALFFVGLNSEKTPIGTSEIFFVAIGFAMLWGSKNFGEWANQIGKKITGKY